MSNTPVITERPEGLKLWDEYKPCERNWIIGEAIGETPLNQIWIAFDGNPWLITCHTEEKLADAEKQLAFLTGPGWKEFIKSNYCPVRPARFLENEDKARMSLVVQRWHMRFTDVPSGAWKALHKMQQNGGSVTINGDNLAWTITVKQTRNAPYVTRSHKEFLPAANLVFAALFGGEAA